MADSITIKQNDTWPPVTAQLKRITGEPLDLTDAEDVYIWIKGPEIVQTDPVTITEAELGRISYTFSEDETAVPGTYDLEFDVDYGDDKRQTVPHTGYLTLIIEPSLDPTGP